MSAPTESPTDWPTSARLVLERACAAYGGAARWQRLEVNLRPRRLVGLLPAVKGMGRTFVLPSRIRVEPAAGRATFEDYPAPGQRGRYRDGRVTLESSDGRTVHDDPDPRAGFRGVRKLARWQPPDALYFFGYALVHYHAVPFTLGEARCAWHRETPAGDTLALAFPASRHTHSVQQIFHFDRAGLIVRHDYVADIAGPWARGAHFWRDQRMVAGFPIAHTRHVVLRLGGWPVTPVVALHAEFDDVQLTTRGPA
jgi:hypothetical protein